MEKAFLDILVMHPNSPSYMNKDTSQKLAKLMKMRKKRVYNKRVIQVEKGSFAPIVFSSYGGMGREAVKFHKRLAQLISEKQNEFYPDVLNYLRTRLQFCLLRSVITSIRGVRG